MLKAVLRLSRQSNLYPQCLTIRNVKPLGEHPVASGGFGEIWMGAIEGSEEVVCLKVVKLYQRSNIENVLKNFVREAIVWGQLEHPNLLPFLGLFFLGESKQRLCLISPWMENGNLTQFLDRTPRTEVNHRQLVWDVANGLQCLHHMKIIHADLKGANILVTRYGRAAVSDFGLSYVAEGEVLRMTSSSALLGGTIRWLAPELLSRESRPSYKTDIYAFGCVCYEIYTGFCPFYNLRSDAAVILQVIKGDRPSRPNDLLELDDDVWALMHQCWLAESSSRPDIDSLKQLLYSLFGAIESPPQWDLATLKHIWRDVREPGMAYNSRQVTNFLSRSYENLQTRVFDKELEDFGLARSTNFRQPLARPIPKDVSGATNIRGWLSCNTDKGMNDDNYSMLRNRDEGCEGSSGEFDSLTMHIGYLTATGREDWATALYICDCASSDQTLAEEAARALRREFKYGEPSAQLNAVRLWAILLLNANEIIMAQLMSCKFLKTLENLVVNPKINHDVKERVLYVVAAAAYASEGGDTAGFKGLWKKIKPHDKPAEGEPLRISAIFNIPSAINDRLLSSPIHDMRPSPLRKMLLDATVDRD
ncbi:Rho guanine nucleotide exchange factor [Paramarasmius palmivorus]|uniref:Rho guanine nucleotide exchange factor n=1 Tax=Paramarasmius palmivorus TaxID=297713 RepID=A0AAW0DHN4_9AGAR